MKTRKKVIYIYAAFIILSLILTKEAYGEDRKYHGSEITHNLISEQTLRRQIDFLCDTICEGRRTGTRGSTEAVFWISRRFRQLGLKPMAEDTYIRHFRTERGVVGRNVVGCLPGSKNGTRPNYILIAAHYDGIGILGDRLYPGADNNASGVVAMLGVAEMLKAMTRFGKVYGRNIIFAAIDAKETNLNGSKALWEQIKEGRLKDPDTGKTITKDMISFMVNIEQIGSSLSPLKSGREDYMIMLNGNNDYMGSALTSVNSRYDIGLDLSFDYYGSSDFTGIFYRKISDQRVFIENGMPAVMFTSGITMNNNKTYDKPETLNMTVLKKRIWLIFHWVEKMI